MKKNYTRIKTQRLHSKLLSQVISSSTSFIKFMVAGTIGSTSADQYDHPFRQSRNNGGIVNQSACADPTPGSVRKFLQAEVNYGYVSAHPYSGLSSVPAASSTQKKTEYGSHTMRSFKCMIPVLFLLILTFVLPDNAEAHFGQYGGSACYSCHTADTGIVGANIYISVNGVEEEPAGDLTISASSGDNIEIDYYFTGVTGNKDKSVGVTVQLPTGRPTPWSVQPGSPSSEPASWTSWSSFWDAASGVPSGWIPFTDPLYPDGYTISFDTTGWDFGNTDTACNDPTPPNVGCGTADLDGTFDAMGTDMLITIPATESAGTYFIDVYAIGHEDNTRKSIKRTLTVNVTQEAPSSDVTDPADGAILNSTAPSPYTISGSASDNGAVQGIEVSIDGGGWQTATCSGCPGANVTWTYPWTLPADGSHTIQSRATDNNSNIETPSAGNVVTIDRTLPSVSSTTPADGASNIALNDSVTINWTEAVDCSTVNTTNITSDSPVWTLSSCSGSQAVFNTGGQSALVTYNVNVTTAVTDANGNPMATNYPFSYTTADAGMPSSSVTDPADGAVLNASSPDPYTISGDASDNVGVASIQVSIDGGAWQPATCSGCPGANVTWTYSWTLPSDGSHTIQSRATDSGSNVETPSAGNTVTIDTAGPSVSSTTPADGATGVALNSNVTINWDEAVDCATVNTTNITSDSPVWTLSSCSGSQAVFNTGGQGEYITYTVNVTTAVQDAAGNPLTAAYNFSYTTEDLTDPVSTVSNPSDSTVLNSSSPDPYTIDGSASDNAEVTGIEVSINGGTWTPAICSGCPGTNVTWTYSWSLPADGNYSIQSRATDASGNIETPSAGNTVTVDRTAPGVSSTNPSDGATGVGLDGNVTINWNEDVDCSTVNTTNITSDSPGWTFSSCNTSQAIFSTSGQTNSATYSVNITIAVTDTSGNAMASAHSFSYTTVGADSIPPSSTVTIPADGAVLNSSSPSPYTISGSASDNVGVSGIEVSTNGGSSWAPASCSGCPGTNVTWTYNWSLPADGTYTIRSRATDTASNLETPGTGNTVTVDRTAPSVSSTSPLDGAINVAVDSNVTIVWDENSNITSNSPGWTLSNCTGNQAVFSTSGQNVSTTYSVNISTAVTDTAGNTMATPYPFSFTTKDIIGQEMVRNPEFNTSAEWNITLESSSSGAGLFEYDSAVTNTADGSGSVTGYETGQNNNLMGTITQSVSVPAGSTIDSASIWSAYTSSHEASGDRVTIELRYSDATIPADGEINVPLDSDVTINFGETMDCSTITTSTITISGGGWTLFSCTGSQAVFNTSLQTVNTPYTVTVTTTVKDVAGNPLTSPYVFSYTTEP
jgi:plastocyanin